MKSFKKLLFASALPIIALAVTSCDVTAQSKTITYKEAKQFATDHYNEHALDTVPISYQADINKQDVDFTIDYETPSGGSDTIAISSGLHGVHILVHDYYAYCASSVFVDEIERYNSIVSSFAFDTVGFMPIALNYILNGDAMTFELSIAGSQTGDFVVRLFSLLTGVISSINATFGYIDETSMIYEPILMLIDALGLDDSETEIFLYVLNYVNFTLNTSSKSEHENFLVDLNTDENGYLSSLTITTAANIDMSGTVKFNQYASDTPRSGDKPVGSSDSYNISIKGSFDFDISSTVIFEGNK